MWWHARCTTLVVRSFPFPVSVPVALQNASFADPFVWRAIVDERATWCAVSTGTGDATSTYDGGAARVFPLLLSHDLVTWRDAGHALVPPLASLGDTFWAPEVAHADGLYWLYYSVGHGERLHHIRVAVSEHPLGPYLDRAALTDPLSLAHHAYAPFAIDAHPFRAHDGRWYLFYARDFLDFEAPRRGSLRAGTALVVRALERMDRVGSTEHVVLRAHCEWQRYQRDRAMYGRTFDWHTLEGPCVIEHESRFFCLYSGGSWQNDTYGVDFAVSDRVLGPYHGRGSEDGPRVLRSRPGVIGPGHCSVTSDTDGTPILAYHAWDPSMTARRMCLAPLVFDAHGPRAIVGVEPA